MSDETGGKGEEEIIELLDVVEEPEPEPKMSINDFVVPEKEEPYGEIASLESWGKLEEEEKIAAEEGFVFSLKEEEERERFPFELKKEAPPKRAAQEEELFEKIELEDILEKVGQMETSSRDGAASERGVKVLKEEPVRCKEAEENYLGSTSSKLS